MTFLLAAILSLIALVVLSGVILAAVTYAQKIESSDYHECCPPGAGCNDGQSRLCRRRMAARLADFEQGIILDRRWIEFCSVPTWRVFRRADRLRAFASERDGIINRQVEKVGTELGELRPQLPRHSEVVGMLESDNDMRHGLQGEVLDP